MARVVIIIKRYFIESPPVEFDYISLTCERADDQTRGGGTGGRSDRDDEAAISLTSLSPRSGEKIKTEPDAKNNESPTVQAGQHWLSCDFTGSPPPQ